jgi:hypothetical protein
VTCSDTHHRWTVKPGHFVPDTGQVCVCGKSTWRAIDTGQIAAHPSAKALTVVYLMVDGQIVAAAASPPAS